MYLDIFNEKSIEDNFKSLRAFVIMLSSIIMGTIIFSELSDMYYQGIIKAITMMMGFWLFCAAFQHLIQKISYPVRILIFLLLACIYWLGIFKYFTEKY
jgi:hypothetical protein